MPAELQPTDLACLKCMHEWTEPLIVQVALAVFCAHVESLRCPVCGVDSSQLAFRTARPRAAGTAAVLPEGEG